VGKGIILFKGGPLQNHKEIMQECLEFGWERGKTSKTDLGTHGQCVQGGGKKKEKSLIPWDIYQSFVCEGG